MPRSFVIRPFGKKSDSNGREIDFDVVHETLIRPALEASGLAGGTTVEIVDAGNIRADMFALILEADLVVCDITVHNANVFYELGVRHALRKRGTLMIKGTQSADTTPFDLLTDRYLGYDVTKPGTAKDQLIRMIGATLRGERIADSPVFGMMPALTEVDPTVVQPLPIAFAEEVQRATTSRQLGWLRLLAEDVRGRRFERAGLRLVGQAQWRLKDLEAARESLEAIREVYPNDVAANLALANVYQRMAKAESNEGGMAKADEAIARVLANSAATQSDRVEAFALRGRNLKAVWRWDFEGLSTVPERRARAMNRQLQNSYTAYLAAFQQDQNHFWSGLGALQMGTILLDLAGELQREWRLGFDSDDEADCALSTIRRTVEQLRHSVRLATEAELARVETGSSNAFWARVSQADVLFAEGADDARVFRRYSDVMADAGPFDWDAVRGQLELYELLGIRADLAGRIIDDGNRLEKPALCNQHVIVFAGHQPDEAHRTPPRFPPSLAAAAKDRIRARLEAIKASTPPSSSIVALASGAPGGDVIFHEVCRELGVASVMCLPIPTAEYVRKTYDRFPEWRSRFIDLLQERTSVLELSDRAELPNWLAEPPRDPPIDFWERGNRWVLAMARALNPVRAYLMVLWDGARNSAHTGGTAHMVSLAEQTDEFQIDRIDTTTLGIPVTPTLPASEPGTLSPSARP